MLLALNLNDRVRVKLTTMGIAVLWKHRALLTPDERNQIAADQHAWTTQLGRLFQVFGGPESFGEDSPFEGCRIDLVEPRDEDGDLVDVSYRIRAGAISEGSTTEGLPGEPSVRGPSAELSARMVERSGP